LDDASSPVFRRTQEGPAVLYELAPPVPRDVNKGCLSNKTALAMIFKLARPPKKLASSRWL
jgi:hypothetical protein